MTSPLPKWKRPQNYLLSDSCCRILGVEWCCNISEEEIILEMIYEVDELP